MSLSAVAAMPRAGRGNGPGILLFLLGIFVFSLSDVLGKWLMGSYAVSEVLLVRSLAALALLSPLIGREGAQGFRAAPRPWLQVARGLLSTLEVSLFYWAIASLPLADAFTFYLAGPIYVTALSALLLKEHVGWRRWSAVVVGFAGVVIALDPSPQTLTWPSLIALSGSLCFALLIVTTRHLRGTADTVLVTWQYGFALLFGCVATPFSWLPPSGFDVMLLVGTGVASLLGYFCINRALRLADASAVAPFQYTLIVWGTVFGYLVFGDVPRLHTVLGAAIIIGAGLFIYVREQARAARTA